MNRNRLVWQSRLLRKKKIEKYRALVLSKFLWGLHLLALTESELRRLDYHHVRSLRRIMKISATMYSRVSNSEVLRRAGLPALHSLIREKQFQMLGAILRAPLDPEWKLCFGAFPNPDLTRVTTRGPAGAVRRVGRPAWQLFLGGLTS